MCLRLIQLCVYLFVCPLNYFGQFDMHSVLRRGTGCTVRLLRQARIKKLRVWARVRPGANHVGSPLIETLGDERQTPSASSPPYRTAPTPCPHPLVHPVLRKS